MSDGARPSAIAAGTLYVVATPIGNLGDLSTRAREVLAGVDLIAAEDTRHTRQLLDLCGIERPLTSLHEHNESAKSEELLEKLSAGAAVALVSDAGTPLISDPGFDLVSKAKARGVRVVAVPGPSAAIAALSISGLATDRFTFEGFLPARASTRRARLERLASEERTMIFYEAPHRLVEVLRDMAALFGADRRASIGRELTKKFETTYDGTLAELAEKAERNGEMTRGEIVIVVAGAKGADLEATSRQAEQVLRALLEELPPSQAARIAARLTGAKRSDLYDAALHLSGARKNE
jgi:16S rRNA (cytidine1402-2'-O)-methyltransferase